MSTLRRYGTSRRLRGVVAGATLAVGLVAATGCASAAKLAQRAPATTGASAGLRASDAGDRLQGATFTARYTGSSTPPQEFDDVVLTLYKDKARSRADVSLSGSGGAVAFSEIHTGDGYFLCFRDFGVVAAVIGGALGAEQTTPLAGAAAPLCTKEPTPETNSILDFSGLSSELTQSGFVQTADRTIAGATGACYAGSDRESNEPEEICISLEGALLYLATGGDQRDELRATSIDASVDPGVFALPYPVIAAASN